MAYYRTLTYAESTKKTYNCHLRSYLNFCNELCYSPYPMDTQKVCMYAAFLTSRLCFSSIKQYLNIIRILCEEAGLPNVLENNHVLKSVLTGIKRDHGAEAKRTLPITPAVLLRIRAVLDLTCPRDILFWATCLVLFYGILRKASLLPKTQKDFSAKKFPTRSDLTPYQEGLALSIKFSKTNQFQERVVQVPMPVFPRHPLCPAAALFALLALAPAAPADTPLLCLHRSACLTQNSFVSRLRDVLKTAGFPDANEFSGHSFRRGGATAFFAAGIASDIIQLIGDWKSDAYKLYCEVDIISKFKMVQPILSLLKVGN